VEIGKDLSVCEMKIVMVPREITSAQALVASIVVIMRVGGADINNLAVVICRHFREKCLFKRVF
jgi:hypothetical protein